MTATETRIGLIGKCGSCGREFPVEELQRDVELNIPVCRSCGFMDHYRTEPLIQK